MSIALKRAPLRALSPVRRSRVARAALARRRRRRAVARGARARAGRARQCRRRGEFLRRRRHADRRQPRRGHEHPQQSRSGSAPVRGKPEDGPRAAARAARDLQRRRLRSVDGQAARRIETSEARDDRRRRPGRQEGRRQPAPLVRPGDDAGRRARDRGRARPRRSGQQGRLRREPAEVHRIAEVRRRQDRRRCARSTRACP